MQPNNTLYAEVGLLIKKVREDRGFTQNALASMVSLTRTSITNIEKGRQKILLHTLFDIAAALRVKPAELMPEYDWKPNKESYAKTPLADLLKDVSPEQRELMKPFISSRKDIE